MKYTHTFRVQAPLEAVAAFHQDPRSMAVITPPPVRTRFHAAPARLVNGAEIRFTLFFGPFPVRWKARIEQVSPAGFVDRQVNGPFRCWEHRHTFVPVSQAITEVRDEVDFHLSRHPFWGLFGLGMWLSLPFLFAFRAWKTRRVLAIRPQPAV
jgi:ligand-binding SRPBCC domain-containing protein